MDLIEIANEDSTGWDTLADVVRVSLPFLRVEVSVQMGDRSLRGPTTVDDLLR